MCFSAGRNKGIEYEKTQHDQENGVRGGGSVNYVGDNYAAGRNSGVGGGNEGHGGRNSGVNDKAESVTEMCTSTLAVRNGLRSWTRVAY